MATTFDPPRYSLENTSFGGIIQIHSLLYRGRIQRKTWNIGSYAGIDYNLTLLCPLHSQHQRIYHGATLCQSRPWLYARVDFFYPLVMDLGFGCRLFQQLGSLYLSWERQMRPISDLYIIVHAGLTVFHASPSNLSSNVNLKEDICQLSTYVWGSGR